MHHEHPHPVVVAVGHDPMDAALAYAADEAARAACGLHLVHVVHHLSQGPEAALVGTVDLERAGHLSLSAAEEQARDLMPEGLPVTKEALRGGVVPSIISAAAAAEARIIVLQRRPLSRAARVMTRSVSSGVAAHARIPVVSVPALWSPDRLPDHVATVTVGVDVPERSEDLLRAAAEAAQSRSARLRILHTWSLPRAYADIPVSHTDRDEWTARATGEIQHVLARLGDTATGFDIDVEVRQALASEALVEAGRACELLVVGRHDSMIPIGSHLGPVARSVLQDAACPVLLADPALRRRPGSLRRHAETRER